MTYPVGLQCIRFQHGDDLIDQTLLGMQSDCDQMDPSPCRRRQSRRLLRREPTHRGGEDEPDRVGAGTLSHLKPNEG